MNRRRLTLLAGLAMAALFVAVLVIRILPQIALVGIGTSAPEFRAVDLHTGRPARLADYSGKVLLINIWATWCQPCRVEMPAMERLWHRFKDTDFRILAVSIDTDDSSAVSAFARELGLSFDILQDESGEIQKDYQTTGVPESFIIDRHGVIVKKVIGAMEWDAPVNDVLLRRLLDDR